MGSPGKKSISRYVINDTISRINSVCPQALEDIPGHSLHLLPLRSETPHLLSGRFLTVLYKEIRLPVKAKQLEIRLFLCDFCVKISFHDTSVRIL